jgi:DNA-binding CsgD family transcriptional regulator
MFNPKEFSFQAENEIKKILSPLTKTADIQYFCYGVNLPDKSGFTLTTASSFYDKWFEHKFPMVGFHLKSGWYGWDPILPSKQLELASDFDIGNGIIYINKTEEKTECFAFGSRPDNKNVLNFYLNNQPLLRKFTHHFKESANRLIEMAKDHTVMPHSEMILKEIAYTLPEHDLLEDMSVTRNTLSAREWQCYSLLLKGYSIADIGLALDITKPTVAVYISRIKHKLQCSNRKEMIQRAMEDMLMEYHFEVDLS